MLKTFTQLGHVSVVENLLHFPWINVVFFHITFKLNVSPKKFFTCQVSYYTYLHNIGVDKRHAMVIDF